MISLTWIGHSTVVVDLDGSRFITDPLLRPNLGFLRRVRGNPDPADWAGTEFALVSHLHYDHTDLRSLRGLGVTTYAGPRVAEYIADKGLPTQALELGRPVEAATRAGALEVTLLPAEHHSRPLPTRVTDAYGFVVRAASGATVWFPGDTSLYDGLDAVAPAARGRIDVALVPIHGWGPRLSPGHMGPHDAAKACALVGARAALPVHFGTFHPLGFSLGSLRWMDRPREQFARELANLAPDCELLTVSLGGSVTVPGS